MLNSTTVGWMPEPHGRGTIGLVWSCLATIFICTWSALHLNLPGKEDSASKRAREQATYVVLGLFAPEWLAYLALNDFVQALEIRRRCPGWSLKRCFFLTMGGFAVRQDAGDGGRSVDRVYPMYLLRSFEDGDLPWPDLKDTEIDDHAQADRIVKVIALSQLIWFVTQVLGRAINGTAVATLELFTLSNVFCSVVTYIVWWEKPYGVRAPVIIEGHATQRLRNWNDSNFIDSVGDGNLKSMIGGICVGFIFGALHLIGWRFHFPSEAERILWQISSIGTTIMSVYMPLVYQYGDVWDKHVVGRADRLTNRFTFSSKVGLWSGLVDGLVDVFFWGPLYLYVAFRLYMFVEMFAGLRNVPQDVYTTPQWTQYFPAFG